jgi:hypothetical protein
VADFITMSTTITPAPLQSPRRFRRHSPEDYMHRSELAAAQGNRREAQFWADAAVSEIRRRERVAFGQHQQEALVACWFLAACLKARHLPKGAKRWMAQDALAGWLPDLPAVERPQVIEALRECSVAQLGRRLHAMVQAG